MEGRYGEFRLIRPLLVFHPLLLHRWTIPIRQEEGKTEIMKKRTDQSEFSIPPFNGFQSIIYFLEITISGMFVLDFYVTTPLKLTREQYIAFLDEKSLDQIVSVSSESLVASPVSCPCNFFPSSPPFEPRMNLLPYFTN